MNVIIGNFFLVIIWGIIIYSSSADEEKKDKIFLSITFIQLVIVHSFMDYFTLPDLPTYYDAFETMKMVSWSQVGNYHTEMEIGFRYYMKAVSLIFPNFRMFLLINSILMLFPYFYAIKKYSNFKVISVLLILVTTYDQSLFVLRQHLAMGIFLFSFKYVEEKKILNYLLIIFLLFFIHKSSVICVIFYFLCQIQGEKKYIISVISASIMAGCSLSFLLNNIASDMLGYGSYVNNEHNEGANSTAIFIYGIMLFVYLFICKNDSFLKGRNKMILSCLILSFVGSILGLGISVSGRLFAYFTMVSLLAVPIMNEKINNRYSILVLDGVIISLYAYISFGGSAAKYIENLRYSF